MNEIDQLKRLRAGLPGPRPEGREAARAALLERLGSSGAPAARRRRYGRRALALAGASCLVAVAAVIGLGSAGGPSAKPEIASAAELRHLASVFPRLQIAGPWQILSVEGTGIGGDVEFRLEGFEGERDRSLFGGVLRAEIQWRSVDVKQRESELLAEGLAPAGQETLEELRQIPCCNLPFNFIPVQTTAYAPRDRSGASFAAVALWQEGGRVFELHAQVPSVYMLYRVAERVETLTREQWLVALKPGGGPYIAEVAGGVVRVEKVKIGEKPNGEPIYSTKGLIKGPSPGEEFEEPDLTKAAPPTIYREGDEVRVVVTPPPK